jgi:hypothetical protein
MVSSLLIILVHPATAQDKPAGVKICIGPTTVESAPNNSAVSTAVRETFSSFLTGPGLSAAPLESRLVSQARMEVKTANCAYLLLNTVKHVHKSGGGLLGRVVGSAAQQTAYSVGTSVTSTAGRIAVNAASNVATAAASEYASGTKTQDVFSLTTRFERADGSVVFEKTDQRKAMSDGEDLLTPLVQQHAEQIAVAVARGP